MMDTCHRFSQDHNSLFQLVRCFRIWENHKRLWFIAAINDGTSNGIIATILWDFNSVMEWSVIWYLLYCCLQENRAASTAAQNIPLCLLFSGRGYCMVRGTKRSSGMSTSMGRVSWQTTPARFSGLLHGKISAPTSQNCRGECLASKKVWRT